MRYGRLLNPMLASQVETPLVGVTEFLDSATLKLRGKFPDGTDAPLYEGGSMNFTAQAVNEGTENDLVFTIDGVVAYAQGDVYNLAVTDYNSSREVTIDINGIGAVAVKFMGTLDIDIAIGELHAGSTNVFIFNNGRFEFIGMVDGDKVVIEADLTYTDLAALAGASTSAEVDFRLPAGANLLSSVLYATADFAGPAITAATMEMTNVESSEAAFGAADVFTGAVVAGNGGLSNGLAKTGVIPSQVATQTWRIDAAVTGANWDVAVSGVAKLQFHWNLLPW